MRFHLSGIKAVLLVVFVLTNFHASGSRYYVNQNAGGNSTGLNWSNAFTDLQSALGAAIVGDDIWVAAGTYKPTTGTDVNIYFSLKNGVSLYGGFSGTETLLSQRDIANNPTNLSGDIGQPGYPNDNSLHVVKAINLVTAARMDGFRIINGYGNVSGTGFHCTNSTVTIDNCVFANNYSSAGGAIFKDDGNLTVFRTVFSNNVASYSNGGAVFLTDGYFSFYECVFTSNHCTVGALFGDGGGLYSELGGGVIDRCIFSGNTATFYGGAIYADLIGDGDSLIVSNSLIAGNYGGYGSAVKIRNTNYQNGFHKIINCTIADNSFDPATAFDEPVFLYSLNAQKKMLRNSIIWGNGDSVQVSANVVMSNCIIQGGYTGANATSVLNVLPQFLSPGNYQQAPFVASGFDYHVRPFSPAIDAGNNTFIIQNMQFDLDSFSRIHGGIVDLGAYEKPYCTLNTAISASPDTVICQGQSVTLTATGGGNRYSWSSGQSQASIIVSTSDDYSVSVTDTVLGCRGTAAVTVSVLNPAVDITGDLNSCIGDSVLLSATGNNQSFLWSTGATTASILIYSAGTFSVTATNAAGCTSTDQVSVAFHQNPQPGISFSEQSGTPDDGIICAGDAVTFATTGGTTYRWNSGATSSTISPQPNVTTSYFAEVVNSSGCSAFSDTIVITVLSNPPVTISGPAKRCEGQTAALNAAGNHLYYSWSTGDSTPAITVNSTGTYSVTATNQSGCLVTDNHSVMISSPHPVISISEQSGEINDDGIICEGAQVMLTASGGGSYSWANPSSTAPYIQVSPSATTIYIVTVTDAGNCTGKDTVSIQVNPLPAVTFNVQDSFPSNSSIIHLTSVNPPGGVFSGNNGVSGNYFDPKLITPGQHTITYTYTDPNECSNSVTQTVVVYLNTAISSLSSLNIKIFPNPAANVLTIISTERTSLQYCLTDLLGKEISKGIFITMLQLDVSKLERGNYVLNIQEISWRVIKQ